MQSYLDTYRRYKIDTQKLIDWLIKESGFQFNQRSASASKRNNIYDLPSRTLPALAKSVVESASAIKVPDYIHKILDDIISARDKCARYYRRKITDTKGDGKEALDSHDHFIQILRTVKLTLNRNKAPQEQRTRLSEQAATNPSKISLSNRFAQLDVDETSETFENHNSEPVAVLAKKKDQPPSKRKEEEHKIELQADNDADGIFAAFCFLLDCQKIQNYLRGIWTEYRSQKVTLVAASLTTNMAFDIITQIHFELTQQFSAYQDYESLNDLFLEASFSSDLAIEFGYDLTPHVAGHMVHSMLIVMTRLYEGRAVGTYDPKDANMEWAKACKMGSSTPSLNDYKRILGRSVSDMVLLGLSGEWLPLDSLTHSMYAHYKNHVITTPMVMACQTFVDIHYILMEDMFRPYNELFTARTAYKLRCEKYRVHSAALKVDCAWSYTKRQRKAGEQIFGEGLDKDVVDNFKKPAWTRAEPPSTPYYLLKHHPVLSGIIKFNLDTHMCSNGLNLTNDWRCVLAVAHIYNALRQVGQLNVEWPDMEAIIGFCGPEYIFVGDRTAKVNWNKRLHMAFGIRMSSYSKSNSRTKHLRIENGAVLFESSDQSPGRRLEMEPSQPLLTVMRSRYKTKDQKPGMVLHNSRKWLQEMDDQFVKDNPGSQVAGSGNRGSQIDPVQMLQAVCENVQKEERHLHFDFMSFNRRCIEILRRLRDMTLDQFREARLPEQGKQNDCLYITAETILEIMDKDSPLTPRYIEAVAVSMSNIIHKQGDVEVKAVEYRMSQGIT